MRTFLAQISDEDFANADAETQADILRSEIVRCRDCMWHKKGRNEVDSWSICTEHNIRAGYVQDDDYCSWGERKAQND